MSARAVGHLLVKALGAPAHDGWWPAPVLLTFRFLAHSLLVDMDPRLVGEAIAVWPRCR